jgi:ribonuclease HII
VAKVFRTELMTRYGQEYPGYGFEVNDGYGTQAHLEALRRLGPSPIHRRTFLAVSDRQLSLPL